MDVASDRIESARKFSAALDACDYARAAALLAENCRYERPGQKTLVGPTHICDSYRESDLRARQKFDSIAYRSEAASDASGGIRLTFFDELRSGNSTCTFSCSQIVYFGEDGRIERIVLAEIAGERDRLNAFCAVHGIQLR
jgi:hypothetical protein